MIVESVWWAAAADGRPAAVGYVDQRAIPHELRRERAERIDDVVATIASLAVRGAPAIGIFGAYGVALARELHADDDAAYREAAGRIRSARPTAVNLAWAVDRVLGSSSAPLDEARAIHDEQRAVDRAIGEHGAPLLPGIAARC